VEVGRDAQKHRQTKFPDMKALFTMSTERSKARHLFFAGAKYVCWLRGNLRSLKKWTHTFADWGTDYLKYDWCGADFVHDEEMPAYISDGRRSLKTGRPIVYLAVWTAVWKWGADVGGNLWRTTGDIRTPGIR
jgi:alpha-galactosidase